MCIGSVCTQPPYRVWERGVSNAVHFGTLFHGRRGRLLCWIRNWCFSLLWKVKNTLRWWTFVVYFCHSRTHDHGRKKIKNSFFFFFSFPVWKQHLGSQVTLSELTKRRMAWVAAVRMKPSPSTTFPDTCLFVHCIFTKVSYKQNTSNFLFFVFTASNANTKLLLHHQL